MIIDLSFIRKNITNTYDNIMFEWKMLDEKQRTKYKALARTVFTITLYFAFNTMMAEAMSINEALPQAVKDKFIFKLTESGYSPEQIKQFLDTMSADQINWITNDYGISKFDGIQTQQAKNQSLFEVYRDLDMWAWKMDKKYNDWVRILVPHIEPIVAPKRSPDGFINYFYNCRGRWF